PLAAHFYTLSLHDALPIFIDMSIPSGKKRFFVYDFSTNHIIYSGLVSHGSGGFNYSSQPKFSNDAGSDCTSLGKYKVGEVYHGQDRKSTRLNSSHLGISYA